MTKIFFIVISCQIINERIPFPNRVIGGRFQLICNGLRHFLVSTLSADSSVVNRVIVRHLIENYGIGGR
jgi:hypothetical protein